MRLKILLIALASATPMRYNHYYRTTTVVPPNDSNADSQSMLKDVARYWRHVSDAVDVVQEVHNDFSPTTTQGTTTDAMTWFTLEKHDQHDAQTIADLTIGTTTDDSNDDSESWKHMACRWLNRVRDAVEVSRELLDEATTQTPITNTFALTSSTPDQYDTTTLETTVATDENAKDNSWRNIASMWSNRVSNAVDAILSEINDELPVTTQTAVRTTTSTTTTTSTISTVKRETVKTDIRKFYSQYRLAHKFPRRIGTKDSTQAAFGTKTNRKELSQYKVMKAKFRELYYKSLLNSIRIRRKFRDEVNAFLLLDQEKRARQLYYTTTTSATTTSTISTVKRETRHGSHNLLLDIVSLIWHVISNPPNPGDNWSELPV